MKQMLGMVMMLGVLAGCARAELEAQPAKTGEAQAEKKVEKSTGWLDNFETAKAEAKASGLPIFAFFTGSDWCGWCLKLHKEVLDEKAFKRFAEANLILFEADFPQRKKLSPGVTAQNKALSSKYGVRGFPTVYLLDAEGKKLGQTGYQRGGADAYVTHLKDLLEGAGIKAKGAGSAKSPTLYEKMKAEKAAQAKAVETEKAAQK